MVEYYLYSSDMDILLWNKKAIKESHSDIKKCFNL